MNGNTTRIRWVAPRRGLIAILRGIAPVDAEAVAGALFEEGFEIVEVPLNSPDPFRSIELIARLAPAGSLIGAGTVLEPADVDRLDAAGGRLVVSPNVDVAVIRRTVERRLVSAPGVLTPSEALSAWQAGASVLKFFPASVLGPGGIAAVRAVLPADAPVVAVGGVAEGDLAAYAAAGIRCFGLGSSLYRPGDDAAIVRRKARAAVAAWDGLYTETE